MIAIVAYAVLIGAGVGALQYLVTRKLDKKIKEIRERNN